MSYMSSLLRQFAAGSPAAPMTCACLMRFFFDSVAKLVRQGSAKPRLGSSNLPAVSIIQLPYQKEETNSVSKLLMLL